jgi:uncharacterized membrane protein
MSRIKSISVLARYRTSLAIMFFVSVVALLSVRTLLLLNEPGDVNPDRWGMRDYRDAIYYPVLSWIEGNNPYDAQTHMRQYPVGQLFPLYSPLTLVVHLPFALFPFFVSEVIYFVFNVTLAVALAATVLRMTQIKIQVWSVLGIAGLILASRPGHMSLVLGQTAFLATLCTWLAIHFANQNQNLRSAVFLTLATFKPTFGVLLFPLLIARRQYRAAAIAMGLTVVLTGAVGLTILNRLQDGQSVPELLQANDKVFQEHFGVNSFSTFSRDDVFPLLNKLVQNDLSGGVERGVTIVIVLVAAMVIWVRSRRQSIQRSDGLIGALMCVTVTIGIYHHTYDTVILWLPLIAAIVAKNSDWRAVHWKTRWTIIGLLTVPAVNYLSTNTVTSQMSLDDATRMIITSINGVCLLAAWIILAWSCVKNIQKPPAAQNVVRKSHPERSNTEIDKQKAIEALPETVNV